MGQWEAGVASGLSVRQVFTRIILPQALQITIPPLTSQFIPSREEFIDREA
ncbi:hypothetical protein NKH60_30485 [Mesorhizobium sp. M1006]|uniref:hypothetical protein n=1 Tax=Mesorhizobium sp. M1006 TaxID=2957048 RepID=UPI00333CAA72